MDYTLIGDGVNLASRLESACKIYAAQVLISEHTFHRLRGTYRIRNIDQVVVKGKTEPVGVYEVLDHHTEETFPNVMDAVSYFNEGMQHYRDARFSKAIDWFELCICSPCPCLYERRMESIGSPNFRAVRSMSLRGPAAKRLR